MIEYSLFLFLHWGLAHDSFAAREQTSRLLEASPAMRTAIPRLLRSKDPEVVARARRIFAKHPRTVDGLLPEALENEVVGCTQPLLVCVRSGPSPGWGLVNTWVQYEERLMEQRCPNCLTLCVEEFPGTFEEQLRYAGKALLYLHRHGCYRLAEALTYDRIVSHDGSIDRIVAEWGKR